MKLSVLAWVTGGVLLPLFCALGPESQAQKGPQHTIDSIRATHRKPPKAKPKPAARRASRPVRPVRPVRLVRPAPKPALPQIMVSALGGGQARTIGEAVERAKAGTRIVIRAGVYRESLLISKPLELTAEEDTGDVFVESAAGPCLRLDAGQAVVRGLTFRTRTGAPDAKPYAVEVAHGRLVMQNCDLSSGAKACLGVHGADSEATLRDCKLHDSLGDGVHYIDHSVGTLDNCDIQSQPLNGAYIAASRVTMRHCRVRGIRQYTGVLFLNGSTGGLESCEVGPTAGSGVVTTTGSAPLIRDCRVHDVGWDGIQFNDEGKGTVEDCESWKAANCAFSFNHSSPTLRRCNGHDSGKYGMWALFSARGTVEDCEVSGCTTGMAISDGSEPIVRNLRAHGCREQGVLFYASGSADLIGCEAWECQTGVANNSCQATLHGCRIHDVTYYGVQAGGPSKTVMESCDISSTGDAGIWVGDGGELTAHKCTVRGAKGNGIWFLRKARGAAIDCDVVGATYSGVCLTAAEAAVRVCRITGSGGAGVWLAEKAVGEVTNCTLRDNKQGPVHIDPGSRAVQEANQ